MGELKQRAAEAEAELKEVQGALKKHHDAGDLPRVEGYCLGSEEVLLGAFKYVQGTGVYKDQEAPNLILGSSFFCSI